MTVGEGEHPLQCPYAFWFSRRAPGKLQSSSNYADNIKLVGKFASVSCCSFLVHKGCRGVRLIVFILNVIVHFRHKPEQ